MENIIRSGCWRENETFFVRKIIVTIIDMFMLFTSNYVTSLCDKKYEIRIAIHIFIPEMRD